MPACSTATLLAVSHWLTIYASRYRQGKHRVDTLNARDSVAGAILNL